MAFASGWIKAAPTVLPAARAASLAAACPESRVSWAARCAPKRCHVAPWFAFSSRERMGSIDRGSRTAVVRAFAFEDCQSRPRAGDGIGGDLADFGQAEFQCHRVIRHDAIIVHRRFERTMPGGSTLAIMTVPTVLVSGAGIAGPALAHWLTEYGYRVIVVELADGIRPGGQTVDLRGAGRGVVDRMGLLAEMSSHRLEQAGAAWVRSDGSRRAEMPVTAFHGNGLISQLEILRGDLVDGLYQATKDRAEYRFGTRISELTPGAHAVDVTLTDGTSLTVDMVVGADGPHSAVRRLVFGPEEQFVEPLGGYHAWFTAPDTVGLDGWYLLYQAPGVNASMRPYRDSHMAKAGLAFRSEPLDYDRHDLAQQRASRRAVRRRRLALRCPPRRSSRCGGLLLRLVCAGAHADGFAWPRDAGR